MSSLIPERTFSVFHKPAADLRFFRVHTRNLVRCGYDQGRRRSGCMASPSWKLRFEGAGLVLSSWVPVMDGAPGQELNLAAGFGSGEGT